MFVCKYCGIDFTVNYRIGKKVIHFCSKTCKTKFQRQGFYSKSQLEEAIILIIKDQNRYLTSTEVTKLLSISIKTLTKFSISILSINKKAGFHKPRSMFEEICKRLIKDLINDIEFEKSFTTLKSPKNYSLFYDAYSKINNILIEFDGSQHKNNKHVWYSEYSHECDLIKEEWAKNNGYTLIRVPYSRNVDLVYLQKYLYLKIS